MSSENRTSSYSPSSEVLSICRSLGKLNDPSKATSTSIAASFSAIVTTALTFPFAAFFNALVLVAFYKNSSLRKQANVFFMALAVTDLIKAVLACPFFLANEVLYQTKLEPSCFVVVVFVNTSLFTSSEFILTVLTCERFVGVRYPIWHRVHVTKRLLVKTAVACGILGFGLTLVRTFTEKAQIPIVLVSFCTSIATLTFAVLIWRCIKKRNAGQTRLPPDQGHQPSSESRNSRQDQSHSAAQTFEDEEIPRLNVPQEVNVSHYSISKQGEPKKRQEDFPMTQSATQTDSRRRGNPEDTEGNVHMTSFSKVHSAEEIQNQASLSSEVNTEHPGTSQPISQQVLHVQSTHRSPLLTKSEKKAAKLATYLALALLLTRILPTLLLTVVIREFDLKYVVLPLLQTLSLMVSLVNPVIFITSNKDIRKACLKLLKCWDG